MIIITSCKKGNLLKTIFYDNLCLKNFEYSKENDQIICRDLCLSETPIVSRYKIKKGVEK